MTTDIAFSADGNYILESGGSHKENGADLNIKRVESLPAMWSIWDLSGNHIRSTQAHKDHIVSIDCSSQTNFLATASWDKSVKLFDFNGQEILKIK